MFLKLFKSSYLLSRGLGIVVLPLSSFMCHIIYLIIHHLSAYSKP